MPYGPTAYFGIHNAVMRHEVDSPEKMSEAYPHLIFEGFTTTLGERVRGVLQRGLCILTGVMVGDISLSITPGRAGCGHLLALLTHSFNLGTGRTLVAHIARMLLPAAGVSLVHSH